MFTSIRLIAAHCTLAALALALAASCDSGGGGGGPCSAPGSAGSVAFTFPAGTFTAGCFFAASDGGAVTFTSLAPAAGQSAAVLQLTLQARDALRNVCPWYPGASATLASSCVAMTVQARSGDAVLAEASSGPGALGTVTTSDWGTGPGQLVTALFSSGAALTATAPDAGAGVPCSGSATTLISP